MRVRPATAADLPSLHALEQKAGTAAHWSEEAYHALFSPEPPPRTTLVAEDENVTGFVVARCGGEEWEIENVVVALERRRSGVGSALLRAVLDLAREANVTSVLLEVRESNAPARLLYKKLGFKECGRRRSYYANPPEDAVLLQLALRSDDNRLEAE